MMYVCLHPYSVRNEKAANNYVAIVGVLGTSMNDYYPKLRGATIAVKHFATVILV